MESVCKTRLWACVLLRLVQNTAVNDHQVAYGNDECSWNRTVRERTYQAYRSPRCTSLQDEEEPARVG